MPTIHECHNYVRITGSAATIEMLRTVNLEPKRIFSPNATDLIDQAGWARTMFGTAWVVNEDNNGPPHVHPISNGGLGISSRFISHEDPPIAFYKKLHATYPDLVIYYEFNAPHKHSLGYGEVSSKAPYSSMHHYSNEQQLAVIARTYHWILPIYHPTV
jgi:hypothetical protein